MKKFIPTAIIIGASCLFIGCDTNMNIDENKIKNNVEYFKESLDLYSNINTNKANKMVFNKYLLEIDNSADSALDDTFATKTDTNLSADPSTENLDTNLLESTTNNAEVEDDNEELETNENQTESENLTADEVTETEQISTLYSLTDDINNSCDEFCQLKTQLTDAILETENLIDKLNNDEIELTSEQKLQLEEQSTQLKNLATKLKTLTTELNFELSGLNDLINNSNYDAMSLKYLIILNNLMNGNEMLEHGLESMRMMNYLYSQNDGIIPPNNYGRMFYGFKRNNEPPVIKNYYIDEDGNPQEVTEDTQTEEVDNTQATASNKMFKSNVDTYRNTNQNIDTFFNTALMDNEFMYGNRGYGYGLGYGGYNNADLYQGNAEENATLNTENNTTQKSKRFNLNKNVDTYKNADTPSLKSKFASMKNGISNFFKKFGKADIDDKAINPVYRFPKDEQQ